jgi:hypothetical protein
VFWGSFHSVYSQMSGLRRDLVDSWMPTVRVSMESRPLGRPKSITAIGWCPRPFLLSIMRLTLLLLIQSSLIFLLYPHIHPIYIPEYFHAFSYTRASPGASRACGTDGENEVSWSQLT